MSFTIPPAVTNQRVAELRRVWKRLLPIDVPNDAMFLIWLSSHSFLTVAYGLTETSNKFCRMQGNMTVQDAVLYASKVMISRTKVLKLMKEKEETQCQTTN